MLTGITSPHAAKGNRTQRIMLDVVLATVPGFLALTWFYGWGVLINLIWASLLALGFEAAVLFLRRRPVRFYLMDFSALVTAVLLALALPPYLPWWATCIGIFFAIVVAKQLFGGLGHNPFNPAMVGYVVLLVSFPVEMTQWAAPTPLLGDAGQPSFTFAFAQIFGFSTQEIDGYTAATALDLMKQNDGLTLAQLYAETPIYALGSLQTAGTEFVNLAFLLGGIYLLIRKIFTWHAPVGMLLALAVLSALFYNSGSSVSHGSPLFHWLTGATMLGAFFIITDPSSGAISNLGRLLFGIGVGSLVYVIRAWGTFPDGVAFAVLLMNFAAPFIDYYTQPKSYGHSTRKKVKLMGDSQ